MRKYLLVIISLIILSACRSVSTNVADTEPTKQLGLAYYSERGETPNSGAFYLRDLNDGIEHRLTEEDEIVFAEGGLSWSLTAGRFAYIAEVDAQTEIFTMNVYGEERQRLTDNNIAEGLPNWSADGTQIAFLGRKPAVGGSVRPYIINADGTNLRPLFEDPNILSNAAIWAPHGTNIALLIAESQMVGRPPINNILVVNAENGERVLNIADENNHWALAWSHDGRKLAFASDKGGEEGLYTVDIATGEQTKLLALEGIFTISWSPDDQWLSISANPNDVFDVYMARSDGSDLRNLTDDAAYDTDGGWSPDGKRLAFLSTKDHAPEPSGLDVYILDIKSHQLERLTNNQYVEVITKWVQW